MTWPYVYHIILPNQVKSVDHLFKTFTFLSLFFKKTVTEYEGHALSLLKECELQGFDG